VTGSSPGGPARPRGRGALCGAECSGPRRGTASDAVQREPRRGAPFRARSPGLQPQLV